MRLPLMAVPACIAFAAIGAQQADACRSERVVTSSWSVPPSDLAADEVAIDVEYLGDPKSPPPTMGTTVLSYRVKRVVAGQSPLRKGATLYLRFEASCRTLMIWTPAGRPNLLVGKLITRGDEAAMIGTRYRDCTRNDGPDAQGGRSWSCPYGAAKAKP